MKRLIRFGEQKMSVESHDTYREWLHLDAGELSSRERQRMRLHLDDCPECRAERSAVDRLQRALVASRIEVAPRFRARVVGSLPTAGWESRHPRSWIAAVAVALALLVGSATVTALAGGAADAPALWLALAAVADLFGTTALAGAGLLAASWQGLGLAVREAMGDGWVTPMVVFGLFVLGLDLLFVRLLVRSRRRLQAARQGGERRS